jgi:AcrR family transcriptional regulator
MMSVKKQSRNYRSVVRAAAADAKRARVVAAGRALLNAGRGGAAFSLDAVARRAGVTRLTVYHQFKSKRGLLEAIFDDAARRGGLHELQGVFEEPDVRKALQGYVTIFCRFWAMHARLFPKLAAVARLDPEIAESLGHRVERRRQALRTLLERSKSTADPQRLVDVLFALTGFEVFDVLSVHGRSAAAVEAIMQQLAADALERYGRT